MASRLTQMRKERTDRAKAASVSTKSTTASPIMGGGRMDGPAGQMTLQGLEDIGSMGNMMEEDMGEMQLITPGAGTGSGGKSKNKKKKKRKNKK